MEFESSEDALTLNLMNVYFNLAPIKAFHTRSWIIEISEKSDNWMNYRVK